MLTHIKEDLLRRLQAIEPEQHGTTEAFLELCSVCALMAQELSPSLPQAKATLMDEALLEATCELANAAEKISGVLHATAAMGKTAIDERADWDGFLNDAKRLRYETRDLRDQIRQLFREGAPVPERELIDKEQQEVNRQREAYSALRQTISPGESFPYTASGNSTPPADLKFNWLKEWRMEALDTLDHWRDTLNKQERVLKELNRWRSIVDTARKQLEELEMTGDKVSPDDRVDTITREDSVCTQSSDPQAVGDGLNETMRYRKLKQCFDGIEIEWQESKWVEVLKLYDEILAIDADNERAMHERPLALCCLIETLVMKRQSEARENGEAWPRFNKEYHVRPNERREIINNGDMRNRDSGRPKLGEYFTLLCPQLTPNRAYEVISSSDLASLVGKPTPSWNDLSLRETVWQPFFKEIQFLEEDEKRYATEFEQELGDMLRGYTPGAEFVKD